MSDEIAGVEVAESPSVDYGNEVSIPSEVDQVIESTENSGNDTADGTQAEESVPNDSSAIMKELSRVREDLARQRERSDYLERLAFNQQPQAVNEPEYDPKDLVDFETAESLVDRKMDKRLQAIEQGYVQQRIQTMEAAARQKYSDYDSTLATFTAELIKGNPEKGIQPDLGLFNAINSSSNPAELAYRIGMTHPDFNKSRIADGARNISQKIEKNLSQPGTLSNAPRQVQRDSADYWLNAKPEEFELERMKRLRLI
jgi:hypothetical protein